MPRSAFSALVFSGLIALPLSAQIPVYEGPEPTAVVPYGEAELQYGELRVPEGAGPFPVVVTIHGGCWLDRLGQGSLTSVAAALVDSGVATWNVNYRRLGHDGGGWPGTFLDVGEGVDHLRLLAQRYPIDLTRVVLIGHSSGAQLAVWAAGRVGLPPDAEIRGRSPLPVLAAVGIDGPMDLAAWSEEGLDSQVCGAPVISTLLGGGPDLRPARYRVASPAEMPPIEAEIFLNPGGMMLSLGDPEVMTRRARDTGEQVTVRPVPDSDHFQLIDPSEQAWATVLETIRMALGAS